MVAIKKRLRFMGCSIASEAWEPLWLQGILLAIHTSDELFFEKFKRVGPIRERQVSVALLRQVALSQELIDERF